MNVFGFVFTLAFISSSFSFDEELIFQLQKHFKGDLILIVTDDMNLKKITKIFYKKDFPDKVLMGIIDVNENLENHLKKIIHSPYANILVFSKSVKMLKKLIEVSYLQNNCQCTLLVFLFAFRFQFFRSKNSSRT